MFIRTERLFLRPAWSEDRSELICALGAGCDLGPDAGGPASVAVPDRTAAPPQDMARAWIDHAPQSRLLRMLVTLPNESGRIIGGCSLHQDADQPCAAEGPAVTCWITPALRGRGFATEALHGFVSLARLAGHRRLLARLAQDDHASGTLLRHVGFRPFDRKQAFHGRHCPEQAGSLDYELDLVEPAMRRIPMRVGWPGCRSQRAGCLAAA